MTKPHVIVTNPIFSATRALIAAEATIEVNDALEPWSYAEVRRRCRNADGLVAFMTDRVDAELLEDCPRLRIVACALKGWDNFDVAACTRAGVWLTAVPDLLTEPTAELAIGLAIALGRNLRSGDALVRAGQFSGWRASLYGAGLAGSTVGILGLGNVGRAIARRVAGFAPRHLLGFDAGCDIDDLPPRIARVDLPELLERSEFIFVALPLTAATHHLLDQARLTGIRRGAFVINAGRGSVVDEGAIADALERGVLGGYAADVFEFEDWVLPGRPSAIHPALLEPHAPTVLTPHLGSAVHDVRRAIEHAAAINLLAGLRGEPPPDAVNAIGANASTLA
jgi:phosphonate dehydrogenase